MWRLFKLLSLASVTLGSGLVAPSRSLRDASKDTYEIYPTVRNIEYGDDVLLFDKNVNFVFGSHVDKYTKEKAFDVVSMKNVISYVSDIMDQNKINVVLEVYEESQIVTGLVNDDLSYISSKIDAYYLEINSSDILLTAKDSDALFYALTSLEYIFEQSDEQVRTLKIKDYSQSELRGFIEGYYGVPWTPKQREELMRFGSKVKTNIYIYAPKDDVYHSTSWRSLYSSNDLKVLKEQIETGRKTKTRLAWAIHPFMNSPMTSSSYETDLQIIKNKFDQIYNAGVRQFVLSADDVNLPGKLNDVVMQRNLANALAAHLESKGDCYNLVFVPTLYSNIHNDDVSHEDYFETLMDGLDESVSIMWTGEYVCSVMSNMAFDDFSSFTGGKKPFIWMNWPVNDYAVNYLLLGKGEVYDVNYDNDNDVEFSGIVSNPLQYAEASKLAIWATADYAWNTKDYDMDKSYQASFKYIENEETDAYMQIAEHLVSTPSMYDGKWFKESESLIPYVNAFKAAYSSGDYIAESNALRNYFYGLEESIDNFIANAKNRKLVDEIRPWAIALKYTSQAVREYLYLIRNFDNLTDNELREHYFDLLNYIDQSKSQTTPVLMSGLFAIKQQPCYVGKIVIQPLIDYLDSLISDDICVRLGLDTGIKYLGFNSVYEGKLENMIDDDESTYCWFEGSSVIGNYIRFDLGQTREISSVEVVMGLNDTSLDFLHGKVQVSNDAKSWTSIGNLESQRCVVDIRNNPVNARFVRLYCDSEDSHWVAIREFKYNTISLDTPMVSYSGLNGIYEGELQNIIDNDLDTYCWFSSNVHEGGYVLIDYLQQKTANDIKIVFGKPGSNDKFTGELQYSNDGSSWTKICDMNNLIVEIDLRDSPITFRYLRMYAPNEGVGWVAITEVMLNVLSPNAYKYSYAQIELEEGSFDNLHDGDDSTYVHFSKGPSPYSGASITLDTRQVQTINNIVFKQSDSSHISDMFFNFTVQVSTDGVSYQTVGNSYYQDVTDLNLDLTSQNINARYIKIVSNWELSNWILINELNINTL